MEDNSQPNRSNRTQNTNGTFNALSDDESDDIQGNYDINTTYESTSKNPFRASPFKTTNTYLEQFDNLYSPQASPDRFNSKLFNFNQNSQFLQLPLPQSSKSSTRRFFNRTPSPNRSPNRTPSPKRSFIGSSSPNKSIDPSKSRRIPPESPIVQKSLVEEAATSSDITALRDGLQFALGGSQNVGNWLPKRKKPEPLILDQLNLNSDIESKSYEPDFDVSNHDYTENIALEQLNSRSSPYNPNLTVDINSNLISPALSNDGERLLTPTTPNFLTRISDRIAGSRSNLDESENQESENQDQESLLQIPSSPMLNRNRSKESLNSSHNSLNTATGLGLLSNHSKIPINPFADGTQKDHSRLIFGNSLKFFSPESKIRRGCLALVSSKALNQLFLGLLIFQIALLTYRHWNPSVLGGYFYDGYNWADYILIVINIVYTFDIFAKIIAYGFYDDRIVFQELGLPHPRNELIERYLQFRGLKRVLNVLGITKFWNYIRNHPSPKSDNSKKSNTIEISDDDNLEKTAPRAVTIETPYLNQGFSLRNSPDLMEDEVEISLNDNVLPNQSLNHTNTFYQQKRYAAIPKSSINRAYMRSSWHRIDFFSMIMFWISLVLSIDHYDVKHHIMIFRALSCLRILRFCNLTTGTSTILASLKSAAPQLIDVALFICCFWLFFGIVGVQSFQSSLTRHCVWTNPSDAGEVFINTEQFCGSWLAPNGTTMPYIMRNGESSKRIKGFRCPVDSQCISGDNPYGGTVNFDNVLQSLEMVFVTMSANTFTDIMYYTMDSESIAASLFFIFAIFILTVWLINVLIAVIVTSFKQTSKIIAEEKLANPKTSLINKIFKRSARERLEVLRRSNVWLRTYYKLDWIFVIVVMLSLFAQCFRSFTMSETKRQSLYRIEAAFTSVFAGEIVLCFIAHIPNWRLFFASKRNCVNLFLAIVTGLIIIGPVKEKLGWAYYWLTIFQLLRFYRVVMATSITRNLWMQIMTNIKAIFDLGLFFFILTFLMTIIMSRFFEGQVPEDQFADENFPFHTFPNTFLGLYVITTTENWTEILYLLAEEAESVAQRSFGSMLLIFWFMLSNTVIMNIFIAIIAKTLEVSEEGKRKAQLLQFIGDMASRLKTLDESSVLSKFKNKVFKSFGRKKNMENAVVNLLLSGTAVQEFLDDDDLHETDTEDNTIRELPSSGWKRWLYVTYRRINSFTKNPFYQFEKKKKKLVLEDFDPANFAKNILLERNVLISKQDKYLKENPRFNNVFYVMSPHHKIRRLCQRIVKSSYGERIDGVEPYKKVSELQVVFVFLATIALVVTACYFTPLYRVEMSEKHGLINPTFYVSVGFICIFSIEFIIKVLADGLIFTPNAYLRSSWNFIDLIVLISLWVEFIAFFKDNGDLEKFVRGLTALRALRLLTISETAKNNFHNTIISGFWKIISAAIISLCLLFPFSIWALNIFNGRVGVCNDGVSDMAACFNEFPNEVFDWSVMSPSVYANPQLNFDRFSSSFATLFEIVSLEGWVDILEYVMSSTGVGTVPSRNHAPLNAIFLVLFNFTSTVFILTLFVSVIISNYSKTTGRAYQTTDQIAWLQVEKILSQVKPSKRRDITKLNKFRKFSYLLTVEKNKYWSRFLNLVLTFHVIALLIESFPIEQEATVFRSAIFMISSSVFLLQVLMLWIAQGSKPFFQQKWNIFSIIVTSGAFVCALLNYFVDETTVFTNIEELFLVGILAFIIPRSNRLSQLLRFASASLPTLISLLFTWVVVFMVFAIAMNQIFGLTKIGPNGSGILNLRSVPKTLIVLFRCSFGEGWNYIMIDYILETPFCTKGTSLDNSDCGNKQFAYVLFFAWNLLSMYIFLNMFVSLILDSFSYINDRSGYAKLIDREQIRSFKKTWQSFDPEGTGYIEPDKLPKLLHSLDGALSFHFYSGELEIPILCEKWIIRNNPNDPYDVSINHKAVDEVLDNMDIPKIRERRKAYEAFMEEALLNRDLNDDPGISFTRILLQLPLYTSFDAGQCLNLFDFLERRLLLQKVEKRLKSKRVYELISGFACRWTYQKNKHMGIRDSNIAIGDEIKRKSYLERQKKNWVDVGSIAPSIHISDASIDEGVNDYEDYKIDEYRNPFDNEDDKYRNPFERNDDYPDPFDDVNQSGMKFSKRHGLEVMDGSSKEESVASGIYVPSSPLNAFRRGSNDGLSRRGSTDEKKPYPKLYMDLSSGKLGQSSPVEDGEKLDLLDLSDLGDTLMDSSWAEAYRQMKDDQDEVKDKNQ